MGDLVHIESKRFTDKEKSLIKSALAQYLTIKPTADIELKGRIAQNICDKLGV